jgi:hypothetical protein
MPSSINPLTLSIYLSGGLLEEAWQYLEIAHMIDIKLKNLSSSFSKREVIDNANSIRNIFSPSFWPSNTGSLSRIPVFIIGMMR